MDADSIRIYRQGVLSMASAEDAIRPPDQGPPEPPSLERIRPEPIDANEEEDTSERPVAPEVEWIPLLSLVGQHFSR